VSHPRDVLNEAKVDVQVLDVDPQNCRISLGLSRPSRIHGISFLSTIPWAAG
jgi:ribosomal protein S1